LTDALSGLDRKAADMTALILLSQKIEVLWQEHNGMIDLIVDDADNARAWDTLSQFYTENNISSKNVKEGDTALYDPIHKDPTLPAINEKGKIAAAGACLVLCIIHAAIIYHGNHHQVVLNHGASALYILQGEYQRSITALMLHSDLQHLAGNMLGLLLLGSVICSLFGTGRGLFLIYFPVLWVICSMPSCIGEFIFPLALPRLSWGPWGFWWHGSLKKGCHHLKAASSH